MFKRGGWVLEFTLAALFLFDKSALNTQYSNYKFMNQFLTGLLNNRHTSFSAIALFACTAAGILWPQYKDKLDEISKAALMYGLVMAGDAKTTAPTANPPAV